MPNASPGSSRTTTASGSSGAGAVRRAHPQAPSEAHRLPVLEPYPFPVAALDCAHARALRDVRPEAVGARRSRLCAAAIELASRVEQRAHQRVAPQPDLAGLGLEHRLIAAVREGDRAARRPRKAPPRPIPRLRPRAEIRFHSASTQAVRPWRAANDRAPELLTSVPGVAPDNGCRCRPGEMRSD